MPQKILLFNNNSPYEGGLGWVAPVMRSCLSVNHSSKWLRILEWVPVKMPFIFLRIFRQLKQLASHMSSFVSGKYIYFFPWNFELPVFRFVECLTKQCPKSTKVENCTSRPKGVNCGTRNKPFYCRIKSWDRLKHQITVIT